MSLIIASFGEAGMGNVSYEAEKHTNFLIISLCENSGFPEGEYGRQEVANIELVL